ncbi:unnamed protein product [Choristocarpus tenellus]
MVNTWDRSISMDVLGHWLALVHVHRSEGQWGWMGAAQERGQCPGGWIPREQILGEEARRRVPEEFMAQDISVANPPTLLLLVERLLRDVEGVMERKRVRDGGSQDDQPPADREDKVQDGVCVEVGGGRKGGGNCTTGRDKTTVQFLQQVYPLLEQWLHWLLITQRPGGGGRGGDVGAPEGAFQWRGRDAGDDRLNALTLASGLDDFPRASHPSDSAEWHVDILCWLAMGCQIMDR